MSDINENVKELFNLRYAAYDGETWDEMCERVISNTFDKLTEKERDAYEEIWSDMGFDDTKPLRQALLEAMQDKCIIPNSPALINAGFKNRSLCACCVLTPPDDNIESIGDFNTRVMLATKAGFGVGANFSKLRGTGSVVNGKDGVASGPVSFMTLADAHLRCLKQNGASAKGGKSMNRNGAAMMVLNCEHPDYELFINAKREAGMTNTNISGWITEEWWNKAYTKGTPEYELFEKQLHTMYDYAECSVLFADTINKAWCDKNNPIEATNPCAEEALPNGGVCDLVAVNMTKYVIYMDGYYTLAFNHIAAYNTLAYILAESILSTTYLPLEEMRVSCDMYHNIGVGIMGLADMLIMLGYVYGSDESASVIRNVMEYTYSYLDKISKIAGEMLGNYHMIDGTEGNRRNAMLNTVAPTGTISMFADVSSGIEPIFSVAYDKIANGSTITVVNPLFRYMLSKEFDDKKVDELIEKCKNLESIQHITEIPKHIRKLFVTNVDVDPVDQVDIVALVQKYIDAGISKTIILPNDYPFEKMRGLIGRAHVFKCKGITVYRNGTREACINLVKDKDNGNEYVLDTYAPEYETDTLGNERSLSSNVCVATNIRQKTGCGHLTIDVCSDPALNENLLKVYVSNSGGCRSNQEAIGRSMYIAARYMTPEQRKGYYNEIVKAFSKIKCDSCKRNSKAECKSCPAGIAKAIKTHIDMIDCGAITVDKEKFETVCKDNSLKTFRKDSRRETCSENVNNIEYIKCPDCGATIPRFGKCYDCPNCGYHTCVQE